MVMLAEPLDKALIAARARQQAAGLPRSPVICLTPQGQTLNHQLVNELAREKALTLVAGRYEGIDERYLQSSVDREISIGDYVLSGGELAALVLIDAIVRQIPGVLHAADSAEQESFVDGLLDCPHYTRPETYRGQRVPAVLLSGNHAGIVRWRKKQSLGRTWMRRPDLLAEAELNAADRGLLEEFKQESEVKE